MKALTCEMCGSTNLLKQDGVFVCQSCGTKYSLEEAKKMMVEGTVDVQGTVKVDDSNDIENLYILARRAKDANDFDNAKVYYEQIVAKKPNDWEAYFFSLYYSSIHLTNAECGIKAQSFGKGLDTACKLLNTAHNIESAEEKLTEILNCSKMAGETFWNALITIYKAHGTMHTNESLTEFSLNALSIINMYLKLGDAISDNFSNSKLANDAWKEGINKCAMVMGQIKAYIDKNAVSQMIDSYVSKVQISEPSYKRPEDKSMLSFVNSMHGIGSGSGGCYVATAVYGSYDCPEVWTLRRFRDNTLAATWYGQAFISTYYAISPTLVKWFGHTEWFKMMWKTPLDRFVAHLRKTGLSDLPYKDKH